MAQARERLKAAQAPPGRTRHALARAVDLRGASRNDGTCPGEMSKTWRLTEIVREVLDSAPASRPTCWTSSLLTSRLRPPHPPLQGLRVDRHAAVPLAVQLLSQPRLGQTDDWMNEIYERWVAAHGVLIVTPVLLVPGAQPAEADDGPAGLRRRRQPRPDHDRRQGPRQGQGARARGLGLPASTWPAAPTAWWCTATWPASRACAARCATGSTGWAWWTPASRPRLDRYIGYYEPYATSHDALDGDEAVQEEVRNVARAVVQAVRGLRNGTRVQRDSRLRRPRQK